MQTEEGFIALIKPLILPELMAREAAQRGIAAEPAFQHKLIQNQNALLRFHVHGAIESRANDMLRAPDLETRLDAWYRTHAARYNAPPTAAATTPPPSVALAPAPAPALARAGAPRPFSAVREEVLGDYSVALRDRLLADKARELRQGRAIAIDEAVLRQL